MNDELNLAEILKILGNGTKLWSPLLGEIEFAHIRDHETHPIAITAQDGTYHFFTKDGKYFDLENAECVLFPSKRDRTWENLKNGFKTFDDLNFKIINYNPKIIKAKANYLALYLLKYHSTVFTMPVSNVSSAFQPNSVVSFSASIA